MLPLSAGHCGETRCVTQAAFLSISPQDWKALARPCQGRTVDIQSASPTPTPWARGQAGLQQEGGTPFPPAPGRTGQPQQWVRWQGTPAAVGLCGGSPGAGGGGAWQGLSIEERCGLGLWCCGGCGKKAPTAWRGGQAAQAVLCCCVPRASSIGSKQVARRDAMRPKSPRWKSLGRHVSLLFVPHSPACSRFKKYVNLSAGRWTSAYLQQSPHGPSDRQVVTSLQPGPRHFVRETGR